MEITAWIVGGGMTLERSLLQKIREKELEMNVKVDDVRREADSTIELAKKHAKELLSGFQTEADKAATEYYQKELGIIQKEIEDYTRHSEKNIEILREKGERNLTRAVEEIVRRIAPE